MNGRMNIDAQDNSSNQRMEYKETGDNRSRVSFDVYQTFRFGHRHVLITGIQDQKFWLCMVCRYTGLHCNEISFAAGFKLHVAREVSGQR